MNLFQTGQYKLNSGKVSYFKIECDALTDDDIESLAHMISQIVPKFSSVTGVPRGGVKLAESLEKYIDTSTSRVLIVDDVLTTGGSMERMREQFSCNKDNIVGSVIFARGKCPEWIIPLFSMRHTEE